MAHGVPLPRPPHVRSGRRVGSLPLWMAARAFWRRPSSSIDVGMTSTTAPRFTSGGTRRLLHGVLLEALHEREHLGFLPGRDREVVEGRIDVAQEDLPVRPGNPRPGGDGFHVRSNEEKRPAPEAAR